MALPWDSYLTAPERGATCRNCRMTFAPRMEALREAIGGLISRHRPHSVACLGAGMLNDIPYDALIESGAEIHLVDWLPNLVEGGIASSIISLDGAGQPSCLYCHDCGPDPRGLCRNFEPQGRAECEAVCDNFTPVEGQTTGCAAFERGDYPIIHGKDVTAGYATAFGRAIGPALSGCKSWRHAFRRAGQVADQVRRHRDTIDIDEGSIDLVTSSMVISQFEHEPYSYFSSLGAEIFGPPTPQEERRLASTLEGLRDKILFGQMDRHFDEIARLLSPGGVCFMAFEKFHYDCASGEWFLVPQMQKALELINSRFDFDFDLVPASASAIELDMVGGRSIIAVYALRNRRH